MIWLLALRNIIRNKKNSVIIIALIGVITFLFFFGNTIIGQSEQSLKRTFVENVTADIVIEKKSDITFSLFGANAPIISDYFTLEPLPARDAVEAALKNDRAVSAALAGTASQISCAVYMDAAGVREGAYLCGIDGDDYFPLFPGITLKAGRFLKSGEYGVMLTETRVADIERKGGRKLKVGDKVMFTAAGSIGFKLREAPLVGVFSYNNPTSLLNNIILIDSQTARVLARIQVATSDVAISDDSQAVLDTTDVDSLFSAGGAETGGTAETGAEGPPSSSGTAGSVLETLHSELAESAQSAAQTAEHYDTEGGDCNFILLRLKVGANAERTLRAINKLIAPYGALAVNWRVAAGVSAILVLLLQALYNAGIIIVCAAGALAIVNILLIAVFRRTREIGTLRALGGGDTYIRGLLIIENCTLGLAGGVFGALLGLAAFAAVNAARLPIHNDLLANMLGGTVLHIVPSISMILLALAFAVVLTFISLLFPLQTAVRIEPVVAVREG